MERPSTSRNSLHSNNQRPKAPADWWRALNQFAPFSIILKVYSLGIMFFDMMYLFGFTVMCILSSFYQIIKPPPMKSIKNEIAVIVGSGRGVGRELAIQLSDLEATVVCVDINGEANDIVVENIQGRGGTAFGYTCDVATKKDVEELVNKITTDVGEITMLFHCCGISSPRRIIEDRPQPVSETLNLCIASHFWLLEVILPKMKSKRHGHIVLLTSVAGLSAIKYQMPMNVSQYAVQGVFESLVEDLRVKKFDNLIKATLAHVYPFIVSDDLARDIRLRIPSYFGTINARKAATEILIGVRRNYSEISIPGYILYLGHFLRLLPRRATSMLRDLLDTGIDF